MLGPGSDLSPYHINPVLFLGTQGSELGFLGSGRPRDLAKVLLLPGGESKTLTLILVHKLLLNTVCYLHHLSLFSEKEALFCF